MTTITNNKLTDERVSNATLIRLIQWADQNNSHYVAAALCELQERREADSAEPAGYHVIKECGKVGCSVTTLEEAEKTRDFWNKRWTIRPYFYTQPALVATGATNSPVIPDGYALVPVEPTDEMIEAAMNCEDVLFNSDESFCVQFGNIYEAMLAAAPQQ
ncbi:hypothetical protein ACMHLZ_001421 [Salmonella enterica]